MKGFLMDLHMHSTASDGSDTPEEIIGRVRQAGINLFALTDHDATDGCGRILSMLGPTDPQFISGVEFSCQDDEGKYHILGYGYDPQSPVIGAVVEKAHELRMRKLHLRLDGLRELFWIDLKEESVQYLESLNNPGKPHIGKEMVKYGFADSKDQAIGQYINKIPLPDDIYLRPEEAIGGILKSGGIPVLAHPAYGSGDETIIGENMDRRLRRLTGFGLQGVEAFYSGFSVKLRLETLAFAEKFDLYVTAGSDYHGMNRIYKLGETGLESCPEMPRMVRRFLEAAGPALRGR